MELSLTHLLIVFVLAILFFGPSRLPKVGASLGETIRAFKNALNDSSPNNSNHSQQTANNLPRANEIPAAAVAPPLAPAQSVSQPAQASSSVATSVGSSSKES